MADVSLAKYSDKVDEIVKVVGGEWVGFYNPQDASSFLFNSKECFQKINHPEYIRNNYEQARNEWLQFSLAVSGSVSGPGIVAAKGLTSTEVLGHNLKENHSILKYSLILKKYAELKKYPPLNKLANHYLQVIKKGQEEIKKNSRTLKKELDAFSDDERNNDALGVYYLQLMAQNLLGASKGIELYLRGFRELQHEIRVIQIDHHSKELSLDNLLSNLDSKLTVMIEILNSQLAVYRAMAKCHLKDRSLRLEMASARYGVSFHSDLFHVHPRQGGAPLPPEKDLFVRTSELCNKYLLRWAMKLDDQGKH